MKNKSTNPLISFLENDWLPAAKIMWESGLIPKEFFQENDEHGDTVFSGLIQKNNSAEAVKFLLNAGCDPFKLTREHYYASSKPSYIPDIFGIWQARHEEAILTMLQNSEKEVLKKHHKDCNLFSYALRFSHMKIAEHLASQGVLSWESDDKAPDRKIDHIKTAGAWQSIMAKYGTGRATTALVSDVENYLSKKNSVGNNAFCIAQAATVLEENKNLWTPVDINKLLLAAAETPNKGTLSLFSKTLKIKWEEYMPPAGEPHPLAGAIKKDRLSEVLWLLERGVSLTQLNQDGVPLLVNMSSLSLDTSGCFGRSKIRNEKTKQKIFGHLRKSFEGYPNQFGDDSFYDAVVKGISGKNNIWRLDFYDWFTPSVLNKAPSFWWEYLSDGKVRLEKMLGVNKKEAVVFVTKALAKGLKDHGWKKSRSVFMALINHAATLDDQSEDLSNIENNLLPVVAELKDKINWDGWSQKSLESSKKLCGGSAKKLGAFLWKEAGERRLLSVVKTELSPFRPVSRI